MISAVCLGSAGYSVFVNGLTQSLIVTSKALDTLVRVLTFEWSLLLFADLRSLLPEGKVLLWLFIVVQQKCNQTLHGFLSSHWTLEKTGFCWVAAL